jgi:hypothetical protein
MNSKSLLVNAARQHDSVTANGAVTHSTSLSACLDMFFMAGATRRWTEDQIVDLFLKAYSENKNLAYRILFWARDCRGGAGEKRFFRTVAIYCVAHMKDEWNALVILCPEYGSWKDIFSIEDPNLESLNWLKFQLEENANANLLAKYFPRKGKWFSAMHKYMKLTPKEFRQYIVRKSTTVEQEICAGKWSSIDYAKVPSVAMNRYRQLFMKHDEARFTLFNENVLDGKTKVNASVLFPHQLYIAMQQGQNETAVEAQWQALPNYMEGSSERILPVCDVSASMEGLPMEVSVGLGLYIAERNEGIFKNAFLTFSETPSMEFVQGNTLKQKFNSIRRANWGGSTDLQATFNLILSRAIKHSLTEDDMPTKLLIISDMEFNDVEGYGGKTNLEEIQDKYAQAGYKMPQIIFWNVNGRLGNVPASMDQDKVGLVSGFSPAILKSILQGEVSTPYQLMMTAIGDSRYDSVTKLLTLLSSE